MITSYLRRKLQILWIHRKLAKVTQWLLLDSLCPVGQVTKEGVGTRLRSTVLESRYIAHHNRAYFACAIILNLCIQTATSSFQIKHCRLNQCTYPPHNLTRHARST